MWVNEILPCINLHTVVAAELSSPNCISVSHRNRHCNRRSNKLGFWQWPIKFPMPNPMWVVSESEEIRKLEFEFPNCQTFSWRSLQNLLARERVLFQAEEKTPRFNGRIRILGIWSEILNKWERFEPKLQWWMCLFGFLFLIFIFLGGDEPFDRVKY